MKGKLTRRDFIRKSCIGASSVGLVGLATSPRRALGYVAQDPINSNIDNLRVVQAYDDAMTTGTGAVSGWDNQNAVTNDSVVSANMDQMARALAEKDDITEAWRTIFIQPPDPANPPTYLKPWDQIVVAIKTNCIAVQRTRNAVMKKMCEVLVNTVGISGTNVHIFDACHGGGMPSWQNLPAGVQVENTWGGYPTSVALPPPLAGGSTGLCQNDVATGNVDILVNIALCKGHSSGFGSFTMCLKNNYGTFRPGCSSGHNNTDYLFSINKSEAILGQMDGGTGSIIHPRQQLCFVDALWASQGGPSGEPSCRPNRLAMGTFGPAVDHQMATRFRSTVMGWSVNQTVLDRFLTEFGYPSDALASVDMVDALTWTPSGPSLSIGPQWRRYT